MAVLTAAAAGAVILPLVLIFGFLLLDAYGQRRDVRSRRWNTITPIFASERQELIGAQMGAAPEKPSSDKATDGHRAQRAQ